MKPTESVALACADATRALVGHDGIVGVGQTADSLALYVTDKVAAVPAVEQWRRGRTLPIEIFEVEGFRPAAERA